MSEHEQAASVTPEHGHLPGYVSPSSPSLEQVAGVLGADGVAASEISVPYVFEVPISVFVKNILTPVAVVAVA